jgi:hypothetical protein
MNPSRDHEAEKSDFFIHGCRLHCLEALLLIPLGRRQGHVKEISLPKHGDQPAINRDTVTTVGAQALVRLRVSQVLRGKLPEGEFFLLIDAEVFTPSDFQLDLGQRQLSHVF